MPTKGEASQRLRANGHKVAADELERWRNTKKENGGWDGWFRSDNGFPELEPGVWPDGYKNTKQRTKKKSDDDDA